MSSLLMKGYMVAYNVAMCSSWGCILGQLAKHFWKGGSPSEAYPVVKKLVLFTQTAAVLEVLHALLRFVKAPVATTFMQTATKILVLWGGLEVGSPAVAKSPFPASMIAAWAVGETIRYGYYAVNLVRKKVPRWLQYLRYTMFIPLYPIGILSEMAVFYQALPHIRSEAIFSVQLPNKFNFAFDYSLFLIVSLCVGYPIGSYQLYGYMLKQRKKVLEGNENVK